IRINDRKVDEQVIRNCEAYLIAYAGIVILSFLIVSLDGFTVETNFSAVMATFNNIGPGLDAVGPTSNFAAYSALSKIVMTFDMLAGRLEIYPIIMLFSRRTWRKRR
ncbi:MAG: potassium transporter TrkG, partial [Lactimicrobium massiliense]